MTIRINKYLIYAILITSFYVILSVADLIFAIGATVAWHERKKAINVDKDKEKLNMK